MLNTLLHYYYKKNKKIREDENPLKTQITPAPLFLKLKSCCISRIIVHLHDQSLFIRQRSNR